MLSYLIQIWRAAGTLGQCGVKMVEEQPSLVHVAQSQRRHYAEDAAAQALFQRQTGLRQLCKHQCINISNNLANSLIFLGVCFYGIRDFGFGYGAGCAEHTRSGSQLATCAPHEGLSTCASKSCIDRIRALHGLEPALLFTFII